MEKKINIINDCEQEIEITYTREELQPHYDAAFKKTQPNIELRGFRKGKVPMSMIKKMYGNEIQGEAEDEIINKAFRNISLEDKIKIVGTPHLHDVKKDDQSVSFTIHYEVFPEFEIKEYKGLTIEEPVHTVTDDEISNNIKLLLQKNGTFESADLITDANFIVTSEFQEINQETKDPLPGKKSEPLHLFLDDKNLVPDLKEVFLNKKTGDTFEYSHTNTNDGTTKYFFVTVGEIQKLIPAILDSELVDKITQGKFQTPEDFKEEIGFQLQEMWDKKTRQRMENQLIDRLIEENNHFGLPKSAIETVMKAMFEDLVQKKQIPNNTPETFELVKESLGHLAERNVRWEIIREKIIEIESLKVEDHDLDYMIDKEFKDVQLERDQIRKELMKNTNILDTILVKKTMDFLLDFAVTTEIAFDGDDVLDEFDDELDEEFMDEEFADEFEDDYDEDDFDDEADDDDDEDDDDDDDDDESEDEDDDTDDKD